MNPFQAFFDRFLADIRGDYLSRPPAARVRLARLGFAPMIGPAARSLPAPECTCGRYGRT